MCYMCGEDVALPKLSLPSLCMGPSRQPSDGQGRWYLPVSQIRKLRQDHGFILRSQQESGKMLTSGPRQDGEELESTNFRLRSQLSTFLS